MSNEDPELEYLTQQGIKENPDLRALNLDQLYEEEQRALDNGRIVHELISTPVSAAERERLIQERLHWMKRRLAIWNYKDIEYPKVFAQFEEDRIKGEEESRRLDLEAAKARESSGRIRKELKLKVEQRREEAKAERERNAKRYKEQQIEKEEEWAEMEKQQKLKDEENMKKRRERLERLRNLAYETPHRFQKSENRPNEADDLLAHPIKRITTIEEVLTKVREGTTMPHDRVIGFGCSGNDVETCNPMKSFEAGIGELVSDQFGSKVGGHNPDQEDVAAGQRESQDMQNVHFQEQQGNSEDYNYAADQQTKDSYDIDDEISKPIINLPKVAESLIKATDSGSAPIWECGAKSQGRLPSECHDYIPQTSTGYSGSANDDYDRYPESGRVCFPSQVDPSCNPNILLPPGTAELMAEQFEDGRSSECSSEMFVPGRCKVLKQRDLPDDKVSNETEQGNLNKGFSSKWLIGGGILATISVIFASILWHFFQNAPKQRTHGRDWKIVEENADL